MNKNITFTAFEHCGQYKYDNSFITHDSQISPIVNNMVKTTATAARKHGSKNVFVFSHPVPEKQTFDIYTATENEGRLLNGISKALKTAKSMQPKDEIHNENSIRTTIYSLEKALERAKLTLIDSLKRAK